MILHYLNFGTPKLRSRSSVGNTVDTEPLTPKSLDESLSSSSDDEEKDSNNPQQVINYSVDTNQYNNQF